MNAYNEDYCNKKLLECGSSVILAKRSCLWYMSQRGILMFSLLLTS